MSSEKQVPPIPEELVSKFNLSLDLLQSAFLEQPCEMNHFNDYETLYFLLGAELIVNENNVSNVHVYHNLMDQ